MWYLLERMEELLSSIQVKKERLDRLRPYGRKLGRERTLITEGDVRNLHGLVMRRSQPEMGGQYADLSRYVRTETGRHMFPSPAEIPARMHDFGARHGW